MSDDHPLLSAVGFVAVVVGVAMIVEPGLASAIGTGYVAVTVVGLLALTQGLRVARARKRTELEAAETPDVETVETVPTPGDDFDRRVAELRSGSRRGQIRERADLTEALQEAAVHAVADRENRSREAASERVETGEWTDDPHAASLLGGPEVPSPPVLDRLKVAARPESLYQYRIRRAADEVARAAGVEADDGEQADHATTDEKANGGPRRAEP